LIVIFDLLMITASINGKEIITEELLTVLEAAKKMRIRIPHFCKHRLLERFGGCRMCVVEVRDMPGLHASCMLELKDGMVVETETPAVIKARKAVLEFLLINHPLDCPKCDKAGECKLQDYTMLYGVGSSRFSERKRREPEGISDPLIVRNMERCIMCTRCVRMCDGVQGASAISPVGRGGRTFIEPFSREKFDCEYCGNCITVCPVGSIMSRLHRYSYRPWMIEKETQSVCPHCGVGCTIAIQVMQGEIERIVPKSGPNNGLLCARGYFGYGFLKSPNRLDTPLLRKNGRLEPVSWKEALDTVAHGLIDVKKNFGGQSIAGIASSRCTNEDNYLFQKLMRAGFGTNNIDSIARTGYAGTHRLISKILGEKATSNEIQAVKDSDAVLVAGGDPTRINPVLGIQARRAFRKGAKVITLGYMPGLRRHRSIALKTSPGSEGLILGALLGGLLKGRRLPGDKDQELEAFIKGLHLPSPDEAGDTDSLVDAIKHLSDASNTSIIVGSDITAWMDGPNNVILLSVIAHVLEAKVYLMSERPNEQGLLYMGCLPDTLPGGMPLANTGYRNRLDEAWGTSLPSEEGLTLMESIEGAHSGRIKAMWVVGENPLLNLPDGGLVREALEMLDFLVVQDIFMTETAEMANVVLPAQGWAEKDGTYVNLEGRAQRLDKAVEGRGMEDWKIIAEVGRKTGLDMTYSSSEDVSAEIDALTSGGQKATGRALGEIEKIYRKPVALQRQPLHLSVGKDLFIAGTACRNSEALQRVQPTAVAEINTGIAEQMGLKHGDTVRISTSKGNITLPVRTEEDIPENSIYLFGSKKNTGFLFLFDYNIEPFTRTPVVETRKLRIKKVTG
jgi:NADH-quinone oxidoreductase chain G